MTDPAITTLLITVITFAAGVVIGRLYCLTAEVDEAEVQRLTAEVEYQIEANRQADRIIAGLQKDKVRLQKLGGILDKLSKAPKR